MEETMEKKLLVRIEELKAENEKLVASNSELANQLSTTQGALDALLMGEV